MFINEFVNLDCLLTWFSNFLCFSCSSTVRYHHLPCNGEKRISASVKTIKASRSRNGIEVFRVCRRTEMSRSARWMLVRSQLRGRKIFHFQRFFSCSHSKLPSSMFVFSLLMQMFERDDSQTRQRTRFASAAEETAVNVKNSCKTLCSTLLHTRGTKQDAKLFISFPSKRKLIKFQIANRFFLPINEMLKIDSRQTTQTQERGKNFCSLSPHSANIYIELDPQITNNNHHHHQLDFSVWKSFLLQFKVFFCLLLIVDVVLLSPFLTFLLLFFVFSASKSGGLFARQTFTRLRSKKRRWRLSR